MPSFQVLVLGFLFVSFHPSSLRSHSCSTSACLPLSPSACPLPIRFLSSASLPVLITQPSASSFLPSVRFASQLALRPDSGSFRPRRFSPSSTPGFPSASSGCAYSAFCLFPFALPCFASHSCSAGARPSLSLRRSPLFPLPFGSLPL